MSEFVLHRNYTHRSTLGHIITFVKGEPVWVPPALYKEVTALGAQKVDGEQVDVLGEEKKEVVPLTPDERREQLLTAFALIKERNNRTDFTGQGLPSIPALRRIVDFEIDKKEVEALWREVEQGQ